MPRIKLSTIANWRIGLLGALIIGVLALFAYFVSTGQWLASLTTLLLGASLFQLHRLYRTMNTFTSAVTRLVHGEKDVSLPPIDRSAPGQLARSLTILAERVRRIQNKRERERDRLYTVLAHMNSGALLINRHGRVRLINPAAAEFLRIDSTKALRRSLPQVVWDYRINDVWQRCVASGVEESETLDLDSGRAVRVIVTPFIRGADRGYLLLLQDLSQMRRLEKIRRDFVSNVSHELRTPLASLRALVDTLRDGALDDPPAAERFLGRIEIEVDKMTQMVGELLELSRIESGQVPLKLNCASAEKVILPAVERLQPQATRAEVSIDVDLPSDLPELLVDVERAHQVVINLVHNAIKFTANGGEIKLSAHDTKDGWVTISVCDNGVGIPERDLPRIFERFYKADRARAGGGTGLGLAICKHIVQAHGGQIWVESVEGQGSSFFFTLPVYSDKSISK